MGFYVLDSMNEVFRRGVEADLNADPAYNDVEINSELVDSVINGMTNMELINRALKAEKEFVSGI